MGYDIWVSGEVTLPKASAAAACEAISELEVHDTWPHKESFGPSTLIDFIEKNTCFSARVVDEEILISAPDDSVRHTEEYEWVFEALAPFIEDDYCGFTFVGEDHCQWRWEFDRNRRYPFTVVESEVVFGADCYAPAICKDLVGLLYDGSKLRDHDDPQAVLDRIEGLLRKHGFGPFAGLDALDAMAKAAE